MSKQELKLKELISDLHSDKGISIDTTKLIRNYCEVEFKESLDACSSNEERDALMQKYTTYYSKGDGKGFMDSSISNLQSYSSQAIEGAKELQVSATKIMASNGVPAVITTGSATSVPNPAYFVIDNSQKKNTLLTVIKNVENTLVKVFESALLLHWELPSSIVTLATTLKSIKQVIKKIP